MEDSNESLEQRDHRVASAARRRGFDDGFRKGLIEGVLVACSYSDETLKRAPNLTGWLLLELLRLRAYEMGDEAERAELTAEIDLYRRLSMDDHAIKSAERELKALDVNAQDRQQEREAIFASCRER